MLAFVHIPKTGGRTLHSILVKQYGSGCVYGAYTNPPSDSVEALRRMPPGERAGFRVISGHVGPDVDLEGILGRPLDYITILRDPVSRVLSTYRYVRRTVKHPSHAEVSATSLDEIMRQGVLPLLDNGQTRMLSGFDTEDVAYDECTSDMLRGAIENLDTSFALVGTLERFDESVLLLREQLGWKLPLYRRRNVTRVRSNTEAPSEATIRLIRRYNRLDEELYRHAAQRLERLIMRRGRGFQRKKRWFAAANRVYSVAASLG